MKKIDWILITATGTYSFLFYEQSAGINFLLFNIIIIVLLGIKDIDLLKNKNWQLAVAGSLLSSLCIALYGNFLSVISNIISLSVLAGLSFNTNMSVILSILFSVYSYCSSPVFIFLDWIEKREASIHNNSESENQLKKVWLILLPVLITLLFFFMYRASNPIFNDFSKKINFDFISWKWIVFTLGGFFILFGFFNIKIIKSIFRLDDNISNSLSASEYPNLVLFGKKVTTSDEYFSGKVLFILLNGLILLVNFLDINFFFINRTLPKGLTYSEFLHQGTGILIVSIIIAISIILFYFRGALNFYEKSKLIKFLVYVWIIQNAFMLFSTILRNNMYIYEYGLTYKRIGVYVYLLLTMIGLATIFIKIAKTKSNNYLFRTNGWLFYGILITSCFFRWDVIITNYNIRQTKNVDINYLMDLSDSNLPQLFHLQQDKKLKQTIKNYTNPYQIINLESEVNYFEKDLGRKLYYFLKRKEQLNWRSWNYENERINNDLFLFSVYYKVGLNLSGLEISNLNFIKNFPNIESLSLKANYITDLSELRLFQELKKLDLESNRFTNIKGVENLKNLEYLNLKGNRIHDYSPLYTLKKLKELHLDCTSSYQYNLLHENLPNTAIIQQ